MPSLFISYFGVNKMKPFFIPLAVVAGSHIFYIIAHRRLGSRLLAHLRTGHCKYAVTDVTVEHLAIAILFKMINYIFVFILFFHILYILPNCPDVGPLKI